MCKVNFLKPLLSCTKCSQVIDSCSMRILYCSIFLPYIHYCSEILGNIWHALFTFIHWIEDISNWSVHISAIQLEIYPIQLKISPNQLEISTIKPIWRYLQLNCGYVHFNWRYLQIGRIWRYLQLKCTYLWRAVFTFIHWIEDISNWSAHIRNSIVDIFKSA